MEEFALESCEVKSRSRRTSLSLNIGLVMILIVLIFALFPQIFTKFDPNQSDADSIMMPPSAEHLFGTDNFGRDVFSRVAWGTRIDLAMGIIAMIVPFFVGSAIGLITGYYGGWIDSLLMRILDIVMSFPFILLVIVIVTIMGPGLTNMFIAIWLVGWRDYARLVRSEVVVVKHHEYIQAAKILGFSEARIIFGHVLPNVVSAALTFAASDIVMCILTGASLSFLGLGAQPPTPEWGALLQNGRAFLTRAWWMSAFPGLAICFAGIGFSMFGDGVSDILRTKHR
jgi:peptide/nickel transport system permease protein